MLSKICLIKTESSFLIIVFVFLHLIFFSLNKGLSCYKSPNQLFSLEQILSQILYSQNQNPAPQAILDGLSKCLYHYYFSLGHKHNSRIFQLCLFYIFSEFL